MDARGKFRRNVVLIALGHALAVGGLVWWAWRGEHPDRKPEEINWMDMAAGAEGGPARPAGAPNPVRTLRSLVAAASFVTFGVAALTGQPMFVLISGFVAVIYGIGSAAALVAKPASTDVGVAGAIGLGFAVMLLGPVVMALNAAWHPSLYVLTVFTAACVTHLVVLVQSARSGELAALLRRGLRRLNPAEPAGLPELLAIACLCAFAYAMVHAHSLGLGKGTMPIGGFLTVIGAGWYVALAVLVGAVGYYAWRRLASGVLFAGLQLVTALFSVTWLAYDAPRSQTAEKHIALVQTIMNQGSLDGVLPIYRSWPAFFAGAGAALQAFGAKSTTFGRTWDLAVIWPLLVALTTFTLITSLCRLVGYGWVTAYVVATVASIANVLQQDYFSPQSAGYLMAISAFAVVLARPREPVDSARGRRAPFPSRRHKGFQVTWRQVVLAATISTAIALTHQFTPFAVIGAIGALFVLGAFRPVKRGLVLAVVVAVPALVWTLLHAAAVGTFLNPSQIGNPDNFTAPRDGPVNGATRLWVVAGSSLSVVGALVLVGLIAVVGSLLRVRNRVTLSMCAATMVGFALIVVSPYGQEGIYRASLFALPWLILLGLPAWHRLATVGNRLAHVVLVGVLGLLSGLYLTSSAGFDASNVVRRADVAAYDYVVHEARTHPGQSYIVIQLLLGDGPQPGATQPPNMAAVRPDKSVPRLDSASDARRWIDTSFKSAIAYMGNPPKINIFVIYSPANVSYSEAWARARHQDLVRIYTAMRVNQRLVPISLAGGTIFARVFGSG